ncbi:MAG: hypothetical protein HY730_08310 [Candidatus Tectomicrobia bacterium]|uniref:Uncharacterized protein n=1 Tax=Tectimicrobiota bacterium TaxID=2528274 RepID=A0A933GLZ6_UNCTE|nr:hypothetical protein [Candidatus Tectomicrobia bacterium]
MGFDLIGIKPKSKKREYFRNNVWYWPRLWEFVCAVASDVLTEEDQYKGTLNDGYTISEEKVAIIAQRLEASLANKKNYEAMIEQSAAVRHQIAELVMQTLKGSFDGKIEPEETHYPFDWENVQEFAEFCKDSGGFQIW